MKTLSKIQFGAIVTLVILAISLIASQNASPDKPALFGLKRIQEKAFLKTKLTPANKVDYMSRMLDIRLSELQNQVNNQSYGYILPSALRYSTLAGQITELVIANNMTNKAEEIKNQFLSHQKVLEDIYVIYPKNTENVEYKYIQDDFNYLKLYLDQLERVK